MGAEGGLEKAPPFAIPDPLVSKLQMRDSQKESNRGKLQSPVVFAAVSF